MIQTRETIDRELKKLRKFIDSEDDLLAERIAYEIEQAIRWVREDTEGWESFVDTAKIAAGIIRNDINAGKVK